MRERERWGYLPAAFRAFIGLLRSHLHIYIYHVYSKEHECKAPEYSDDTSVSYRIFDKANKGDLIALAKNPALEISEAFIESAIGKGDFCAATLIDGQIVSYSWSAFNSTHDTDGIYVTFPQGSRYGYKAFTLPEYRGRRLIDGLIPLRDRYCAEKGCHRTVSYTHIANFEAKRRAKRKNATPKGWVIFYKMEKVFWAYHSPGARRIGLRFQYLGD